MIEFHNIKSGTITIIQNINDNILDPIYIKSNVCICHQCDCATLEPRGLYCDMIKHFGRYINPYRYRNPMVYGSNLATVVTRAQPGTIDFCNGVPCVVNLFDRYLPSNYSIGIPTDEHMRLGIARDYLQDRQLYFESCLDHLLYDLVNIHTQIDTVVFLIDYKERLTDFETSDIEIKCIKSFVDKLVLAKNFDIGGIQYRGLVSEFADKIKIY